MNSKAQVFSGEFLLAYFIFMTVIILALLLWYNTTRDVSYVESYKLMEEKAVDAAEQLVRTPGIPDDWNATNVLSVGLANGSRILSAAKIGRFLDLTNASSYDDLCDDPSLSNYDCNRHLLGLSGYDFQYNISHLNGSIISVDGKLAVSGKAPINQTRLITIQRTALLDGETVKTTLTVWYTSAEENI
jgi:hypothetical protein